MGGIKGGRSPNLCPFAFFLNFESTYLGGEHFNKRVAMFNLFDFYYYLMLFNGLPCLNLPQIKGKSPKITVVC